MKGLCAINKDFRIQKPVSRIKYEKALLMDSNDQSIQNPVARSQESEVRIEREYDSSSLLTSSI
jgi:hypothetical protein